ncbi:MAG: hypothetical protein ACYCWW_05675 [Deltaproteobacteria bacterium]
MNVRALALSLLCLACSKPAPKPLPPLALPAGCQPLLAGADCFLPYPSDFFRVPDAGTATGYGIRPTGAAKLTEPDGGNTPGASADVTDYRPLDGYSTLPTIVAFLPEPVSPRGFVPLAGDPDASVQPSSNALLVEADTGAAIPTFVDLDPRATDPARQAIVLHPLVGLAYETRYVVLLQGVSGPDGGVLPAPEGFRRLRDEQTAGDPALGPLQAHYDQAIFPVAEKAGLARGALQLAWDFTTGSEAQVDADMFRVRQLTLAWLAQNTPAVAIGSVTVDPSSTVWLRIEGSVTGPLFSQAVAAGSPLFRGAAGEVEQNGTTSFDFTAQVPASVRDQFGPGRTVAYGHGFFGSREEVTYGNTTEIEQALAAVFFGIDWWGMSTDDVLTVASNLLSAPDATLSFAERVPQAMANWLVMTAAMRGPLLGRPAFRRPQSGEGVSTDAQGRSNAGQPFYDGQTTNYLGISQGAILGGVLASLSPDFDRICLDVGGAGFTAMMWRAQPFSNFLYFLQQGIPDPLVQQEVTASYQPLFDRIDPQSYAPHVLGAPLPQSPLDRRVLMQNGLGDLEVPNLATFIEARRLGLPELSPNDYPIYGVPEATAPVEGSALQLFDFGIDTQAAYALASPNANDDNGVHESVRVQPAALAQLSAFFTDAGVIENPCDGGVCDGTIVGGTVDGG